MKQLDLWKKLLPGFIPIFVFILVDEVWGTVPGIIVAVVTGILQLGWTAFREKRFDTFILFDTLLLVVLGGVSIVLDNDLFFKLKPAFIGFIFVAILGISSFTSLDIVGQMMRRYTGVMEFTPAQITEMRRNLKIFFVVMLLHTALVLYAAWFMSKEAWAFISGGLLYIVFGVLFVYQLIMVRLRNRKLAGEEWLPLVNEEGEVTGKAPRSVVHNGSRLLHPVVHLHVITPQKTLLLQKRPLSKAIQPGKWDTAVGGHIGAGETLETALKRETAEEIGLKEFTAKFLTKYHWEYEVENELVYVFVSHTYKGVSKQSDEVDELRFWTKNEIEKNLGTGIFTPNLEHDYKLLKMEKFL
jgi:isopentenyldiphosphate isomerase/intracellular septation protein A